METPTKNDREIRKIVDSTAEALVVFVASYEAIPSIKQILNDLPPDFEAAILILTYGAPVFPTKVDNDFASEANWKTSIVRHTEELHARTVYLPPPGRFLEVTDSKQIAPYSRIHSQDGRPPGERLISTAAQAFKDRSTIVILSGCGNHGTPVLGLAKTCGATIVSEDPETAESSCMPKAAVETGFVDHIVQINAVANQLQEILSQS